MLLRDVVGPLELCTEVCCRDLLLSPPAWAGPFFSLLEPKLELATGADLFSGGNESNEGEKGWEREREERGILFPPLLRGDSDSCSEDTCGSDFERECFERDWKSFEADLPGSGVTEECRQLTELGSSGESSSLSSSEGNIAERDRSRSSWLRDSARELLLLYWEDVAAAVLVTLSPGLPQGLAAFPSRTTPHRTSAGKERLSSTSTLKPEFLAVGGTSVWTYLLDSEKVVACEDELTGCEIRLFGRGERSGVGWVKFWGRGEVEVLV